MEVLTVDQSESDGSEFEWTEEEFTRIKKMQGRSGQNLDFEAIFNQEMTVKTVQTIPLNVVKNNLQFWVPSIQNEVDSLENKTAITRYKGEEAIELLERLYSEATEGLSLIHI